MNRRDLLKLSSYAVAAAAAPALGQTAPASPQAPVPSGPVPRWDPVELSFLGPTAGKPFLDVSLTATFRQNNRVLTVEGFYDGDGKYTVRFMPDEMGEWSWTTTSNAPSLHGQSGVFACVAPASGNHGPVSVRDGYHFSYADGTPYVECGTTCYAWAFQSEDTQRQTLETLSASPFNKLRMCLFPKWYQHNRKEPPQYPFPRNGEVNDYSTFSDDPMGARRANDSAIFYYFDEHQPAEGTFALPEGKTYTAEYIDTLELTRTPLPGEYSGKADVKLPGTPWGSLWFRDKNLM